jgi:fermentation-respiration switch protein FrsA (DUF1100 family)
VLIAHGTADQLIPYAHGQRLFAAAGKPRRFFSMQGIGHNDSAGRILREPAAIFECLRSPLAAPFSLQ